MNRRGFLVGACALPIAALAHRLAEARRVASAARTRAVAAIGPPARAVLLQESHAAPHSLPAPVEAIDTASDAVDAYQLADQRQQQEPPIVVQGRRR